VVIVLGDQGTLIIFQSARLQYHHGVSPCRRLISRGSVILTGEEERDFIREIREPLYQNTERRTGKSSVFLSATRTRNSWNELQVWHLNCCLHYLKGWDDVAEKN